MDGTANEHPRAKVCITAFDGWFWLTIRFLENGLALGFIKTVMLEKCVLMTVSIANANFIILNISMFIFCSVVQPGSKASIKKTPSRGALSLQGTAMSKVCWLCH